MADFAEALEGELVQSAAAIRRPRQNSAHHHLYVHGKGGTEREIPIPTATHDALEGWLGCHPQRRGRSGLREDQHLFVRLGPHGRDQPGPLSNAALHKLVGRYAKAAGIPKRLRHPHVLRAYYATTLASEGVPIHIIANRLGHADIQTTRRYLAEIHDDIAAVADTLDRHHQAQRRARQTG